MKLAERIARVDAGLMSRRAALLETNAADLEGHIVFTPVPEATIVSGVAAGRGSAIGVLVTDTLRAVALAQEGARVVLLLEDAEAEDVPAIKASAAVVTLHGITGGAAIIARGFNKPCVAIGGAVSLRDRAARLASTGAMIPEESFVGVDASQGFFWIGPSEVTCDAAARRVLRWARRFAGSASTRSAAGQMLSDSSSDPSAFLARAHERIAADR
jgi:pyruvate, orthophosphate dikinase